MRMSPGNTARLRESETFREGAQEVLFRKAEGGGGSCKRLIRLLARFLNDNLTDSFGIDNQERAVWFPRPVHGSFPPAENWDVKMTSNNLAYDERLLSAFVPPSFTFPV